MASGYTHCKCRDCFDVTVSDDVSDPGLCSLCEDAGCTGEDGDECRREDAYGEGEDPEAPSALGSLPADVDGA